MAKIRQVRTAGVIVALVGMLSLWVGCSSEQKDRQIKGAIASKAKQEIAFAGMGYTVTQGVVILNGNCPTQKDKDQVETIVKQIAGVQQVQNNIVVGPVVLTKDRLLQQSVDSLLTKYPQVQGMVKDSVVVLEGKTKGTEAGKLMQALASLKVRGVKNQLQIQ